MAALAARIVSTYIDYGVIGATYRPRAQLPGRRSVDCLLEYCRDVRNPMKM